MGGKESLDGEIIPQVSHSNSGCSNNIFRSETEEYREITEQDVHSRVVALSSNFVLGSKGGTKRKIGG